MKINFISILFIKGKIFSVISGFVFLFSLCICVCVCGVCVWCVHMCVQVCVPVNVPQRPGEDAECPALSPSVLLP